MKRVLTTVLAVALLLGLGALAVLAMPNAQVVVNPTSSASTVLAAEASIPHTAAAPDAGVIRYNWITLPLEDASLIKASNLKAHLESNSTPTGITAETVEEWQATGQGWRTYDPSLPAPLQDDFELQVGHAYRIAISGTGSDVTWSIVGGVPAATIFTYDLEETADTDFNWVMLPLDKSSVTKASQFKADIEAYSSGGISVTAIEEWQTIGQGYRTYDPSLPPALQDDFLVRIGYPYRVSVDVTSGGKVTWPVR